MRGDGEYMGLHFQEELHFHLEMLGSQPLVHPGPWRYLNN